MLRNLYKYLFVISLFIKGFSNDVFAQDTLTPVLSKQADTTKLSLPKNFFHADSLHSSSDSLSKNKSGSIESPVSYSSDDSIRFFAKSKNITIYGNGEVKYEDLDLKSENIVLDMTKREVYARGKNDSLNNYRGRPNFKQGSEEFDSDTLKYNLDSKKGLVYGLITKQEDGYLHSQKTKVLPNKEVNVKSGKFTTCDLDHPHFYIGMTKALVIPNDKIVTGPAYLVIEDVPIPLGVPFGFFPNKKGSTSGIILPTFGNDPTRGYYIKDGGYYWNMNDYVDMIFLGDLYTLGSWRLSNKTNYKVNYKFSGNFSLEYASLVEDEIRESPSFSVVWAHTQAPEANRLGNFGANVNFQTSGHNRKNAESMNDYLKPSISSSITYSKSLFKVANLTISALHNQNLTDSVISLSLPNVAFSASSLTPFKRKKATGKTRWYEDIRVGYSFDGQNRLNNVKMDSTFYSKSTLEKFQKGVNHSVPISTTFKLLKYFSLTPSVTFKDRWLFQKYAKHWDDSLVVKGKTTKGGEMIDTTKGMYNVWDYSFSTGLSTNIYGMFLYKGNVIKALRHKITPSISYTFTPDFGSDKYGYWKSYNYKDKYEVRYSPYENSMFDVPQRGKQSSVNFSLANSFELKVRDRKDTVSGVKKIILIDDLSASTSYNFAADSMNWDYIYIAGSTNLFKRISVRYTSTLDPYRLGLGVNGIQRKNDLMFDSYGKLWRIDKSLLTISTSIQLGPLDKEKKRTTNNNGVPYFANISIPWNMSINYSWNLPRKYYYTYYNEIDSVSSQVLQTLGISGTINLTSQWKMNYSTGWDFMANKITYTRFDFSRTLHCWDMTFLWIPMGGMQRYEFGIKVRSGMLKELKLDKKKSYGSVYY